MFCVCVFSLVGWFWRLTSQTSQPLSASAITMKEQLQPYCSTTHRGPLSVTGRGQYNHTHTHTLSAAVTTSLLQDQLSPEDTASAGPSSVLWGVLQSLYNGPSAATKTQATVHCPAETMFTFHLLGFICQSWILITGYCTVQKRHAPIKKNPGRASGRASEAALAWLELLLISLMMSSPNLWFSGSLEVHQLNPSEARRFTWDNPAGVRMLSWSCMEHSGELDLMKVRS